MKPAHVLLGLITGAIFDLTRRPEAAILQRTR